MLDLGFSKIVNEICFDMGMSKEKKTLLFSATFPADIMVRTQCKSHCTTTLLPEVISNKPTPRVLPSYYLKLSPINQPPGSYLAIT